MSLIYYFIFLLIIISSFIEFFNDKKSSKYWYFTVVCLMCLTAGLGYALSPDWLAYFQTFRMLENVEWIEFMKFSELSGMEAGYLLVNKLFGDNGFDFGFITLLIATCSLLLKSSTFYKYSVYPFFVLLIYTMPNYFFEEHVHIRQGISVAIAVFSVRYIIDKKLIKFLICILIGYQFHEGIIVFSIAYWISRIKFNEFTFGWLITIAIIGNYTGLNTVIEFIMEYMPFGQDKFEDYQSQLYAESDLAIGDIVKIISVLTILIYNKYANQDKIFCVFRNLYIMGVLLYFFLGKGIFGIRLPGFYLVFLGLTLGKLLENLKYDTVRQYFIYLSFVFYTCIMIFWFQYKQGHKSNFANYSTFFKEGAAYGLWKN